MKPLKDKFSVQSDNYKKFRPKYPEELYEEILKHVQRKEMCWDCGTGNGQVAVELARYFKRVYASDISVRQIENAEKRDNIQYSIQRAEKTTFNANTFDLITVGQAIHWFDMGAFNKEVKRIAKDGAVLSIWGYGLLQINEKTDKLIEDFYKNILGRYWDEERKYIDQEYKTIFLDFEEIDVHKKFSIRVNWSPYHLEGYLNSWSAVRNYINDNNGKNPVGELLEKIQKIWPDNKMEEISFPLFIRMFRIKK